MGIETFLERNYINPVIKKFTDRHLKQTDIHKLKCTGCKDYFERGAMVPVKYGNKQINLCIKCFKKHKRRV